MHLYFILQNLTLSFVIFSNSVCRLKFIEWVQVNDNGDDNVDVVFKQIMLNISWLKWCSEFK